MAKKDRGKVTDPAAEAGGAPPEEGGVPVSGPEPVLEPGPVAEPAPGPTPEAMPGAPDRRAAVIEGILAMAEESPEFREELAALIESHARGGMNVPEASIPAAGGPGAGGAAPAGPATAGAPAPSPAGPAPAARPMPSAPPGAGPQAGPPQDDRLGVLEARFDLQDEMGEARKDYEALRGEFPMLPEFDRKAILTFVKDHTYMPLSEAVELFVMQQVRQGEGSLSDRLIAGKLANRPTAPRVMGPGGAAAGGAPQEPPKDMAEANLRAKGRANEFFEERKRLS